MRLSLRSRRGDQPELTHNKRHFLTWILPNNIPTGLTFGGIFFAAGCFLFIRGQVRAVIALIFLCQLVLASALNKRIAICFGLAYLILLGDIRRVVNWELGFPSVDLLLLVGPLVALWLTIPIFAGLKMTNPLSKLVAGLMAIMVLEIFNPLQGGVQVGLVGAVLYFAPLLWFWIGREFGTPDFVHQVISRVILPLGLAAACLGLAQAFLGFFPWEQAWIDTGAQSMKVGDAVRAFGFSVSPAEYGRLLMIVVVILAAKCIAGQKLWAALLPLPIAAMILESQRGPILETALAVAVMWGLRRARTKGVLIQTAVMLAVLLLAVYSVASHFATDSQTKGTNSLLQHQAAGLSHPLDSKKSTLGLHLMYFGEGLVSGFTHPLGFGIGATTLAAARVGNEFGDTPGFNTELDITDMFEDLGLIGGTIYLSAYVFALRSGFYFVQTVPRVVGLAVAGILTANLGSWLLSGEYSTGAMLWFLIGAISSFTNYQRPLAIRTRQNLGVPEAIAV